MTCSAASATFVRDKFFLLGCLQSKRVRGVTKDREEVYSAEYKIFTGISPVDATRLSFGRPEDRRV